MIFVCAKARLLLQQEKSDMDGTSEHTEGRGHHLAE